MGIKLKNWLLVLGLVAFLSCNTKTSTVQKPLMTNSKASMEKPYLILVSLDGFRWDYVERFSPPHMSEFISKGVKSEALIPSFPSKTFPNHYSIVTGMYPDNHGIIGNSFYSYEKNLSYKIGNRQRVEDGSFYKGTPIWVQAEREKMVSASYFFVGSEANVQGLRPTYYYRYDGSVKNEDRVSQVLTWLNLPEEQRPHIITMYFSDMDDIGHGYGPNDDVELKKKLFALDKNLGDLFNGAEATGLPVNIMIVSDHGMTEMNTANAIAIEDVKDDAKYMTINNGAIVNIHPNSDQEIDSIYQLLKDKEHHFKVYKTENTPGFEYSPTNKDWGTIQLIPDYGYYFFSAGLIAKRKLNPERLYGVHGYDPAEEDMHGIFYANGPAFKNGYSVAPVKNIHVYPVMCEILDLKIPENIDGDLSVLEEILADDD